MECPCWSRWNMCGRPPPCGANRPTRPAIGPQGLGGYEFAPVGRWGWAIGRVSPGVRTAIRPCRPPRSPYPRRQGRRPGSLFPQRAPWDQGKEREESELFYLPTVSQQFSDGVTGAIAPPPILQKEIMYNLKKTCRCGQGSKPGNQLDCKPCPPCFCLRQWPRLCYTAEPQVVSGWINPESMTIRDCIALFVPLVTPPKEPGSRYDSIALVSLMTGSSQIRVLLVLLAW